MNYRDFLREAWLILILVVVGFAGFMVETVHSLVLEAEYVWRGVAAAFD